MWLRSGWALGVFVVAAVLAWEAWRIVTPAPALQAAPAVLEVLPNEGVLGIAGRLVEAGVIRSREGFVLLALVRGSARALRAGEYEFPQGASTPRILGLLESGRVRQHVVLQPEGATVAELARALERAGLARAEDVLHAATDPALLRSLGVEAPSLEGYLFPDTYHFVRGMTPQQMLARMVQRLHAKLTPELRERAAARRLSLHQLLTLASIVEREAVAREELRVIAGVFWNRLRLGMPLQADPTVQYAVGKERRALTRADLQAEHLYNTYRRSGLPPGPIASPGFAAVEATLDPAPVKYLYFVARDDQRHHFSTSIEEHRSAIARYRLAR